MNIAIIPARGGSKRIPRKNIKNFCGAPIIDWAIKAALASKYIDLVIVSTDDNEIANVAIESGAQVPFIRPSYLSDDNTVLNKVIIHALNEVGKVYDVNYVCTILPTAALIRPKDIDEAFKMLSVSQRHDFLLSVTDYSFPIQRAIKINEENEISMFHPEHLNTRSQDLDKAWHDAGQFYWGKAIAWLEDRNIFSSKTLPYKLPGYRVQDIDTIDDWYRAELIFKILRET